MRDTSPPPGEPHRHPEPEDPDRLEEAINEAMLLGATRTMQQDAPYALRQLADVALKALSPGINDPTTAQDAIFHLAAVLAELIRRDPPQPVVTERDGRHLVAARQPTPVDLVQLAFAETRRAAAEHPAVCIYLLEAIELVVEPLVATGMTDRATPRRPHWSSTGVEQPTLYRATFATSRMPTDAGSTLTRWRKLVEKAPAPGGEARCAVAATPCARRWAART